MILIPDIRGQVSKDEFVSFIKSATSNRRGPEYRQLYYFLLYTFKAGDADRRGRVDFKAFDTMIEKAAEAPRRFGLAPTTKQMFKTDEVGPFLFHINRVFI